MIVMKEAHVEPESRLKLSVTCTAPGVGAIDPLNPTGELTEIGDVGATSDIDVDLRKFAVSVIGPLIVIVGLPVPENELEPVPVHPVKEYPEFAEAWIVTFAFAFCHPEVGVTVPPPEGLA